MGGACSTCGGRGEMFTGLWWGNLRKRYHLEHPGVDNIKMDLQAVGWGSMYWIDLAWGRDRWQALVNVVMNLQVP